MRGEWEENERQERALIPFRKRVRKGPSLGETKVALVASSAGNRALCGISWIGGLRSLALPSGPANTPTHSLWVPYQLISLSSPSQIHTHTHTERHTFPFLPLYISIPSSPHSPTLLFSLSYTGNEKNKNEKKEWMSIKREVAAHLWRYSVITLVPCFCPERFFPIVGTWSWTYPPPSPPFALLLVRPLMAPLGWARSCWAGPTPLSTVICVLMKLDLSPL